MLNMLLDEHISPTVAKQLTIRSKEMYVVALARWQDGDFLSADDEEILAAAFAQHLTLVTYDLRTIPAIIKSWSEQGRSHGGVIFVDQRSFAPSDIGGLVLALEQLWLSEHKLDWTNRVVWLFGSYGAPK
jgi:hypothetical protein